MPDICTLTVRAKKLGIVCPYPMGGTRFNTGNLEQKRRTCRALEQTHMSYLGKNKQNQAKYPPGWSCLNRKHRTSLLQLFGVTDKATSHFWNTPDQLVSPTSAGYLLHHLSRGVLLSRTKKTKTRHSFVTGLCVLLPLLTFKVGHGPNSAKNLSTFKKKLRLILTDLR